MNKHWLGFALVLAGLTAASAHTQEAGQETIHKELRAFRESLTEAVLKKDFERQLEHVSENVVITWQTGEVVRGKKALREFMEEKLAKSPVFLGYKEKPAPAELTILYGDGTGISYGTSVSLNKLAGKEFELTNHWSATLVKENGRWVISNYHVCANLVDNPLLNSAKTAIYWAGGIALAIGLLLGWLVPRLLAWFRRPAPASAGAGP